MPKRCYVPNTTRNIELMSVQDRSTYFDSSSLRFRYGSPYHIETSPLICSANQWTGFYMVRTSVMKELNNWKVAFPRFTSREFSPQVQSSAICVICNAWVFNERSEFLRTMSNNIGSKREPNDTSCSMKPYGLLVLLILILCCIFVKLPYKKLKNLSEPLQWNFEIIKGLPSNFATKINRIN